jgi:glucose/arabinose dehydrogenase
MRMAVFCNIIDMIFRCYAQARLLIVLSTFVFCFNAHGQTGEQLYVTYCAGCHGSDLRGSTPLRALIKNDWKHGGDKASIVRSIANGIPGTEMIKWQGTLSGSQIGALADFILAAQSKRPETTTADKPLTVSTDDYQLKIERLVSTGLNTPWGIEFVDATRALISQRSGELSWLVNGKLDPLPVKGTPATYAQGVTGGYMDIALDPEYARTGWVYLAYSENSTGSLDENTPGMTKIVRGKIHDHRWVDQQVLFQVHDSLKLPKGARWGCRFLFDKQGKLFFSIGDMGRAEDSQILTRPSGKVYRINADGTIPKDNPLVGKKGFLEAIYCWGNRNVQGIAQHPTTGRIYATEHGPKGGDELNILRKGANYGWPIITYGIDYDGSVVSKETKKEGMEQPIAQWTPSIAVSAIEFVNSPLFSKWKNNLIVASLAFQEIRRLVIDNDQVKSQEIMLKGYGRVREVKFGPDGALYVLLNGPDEVVRITPRG